MAKITIDKDACIGCSLCVNNCPEVFAMGENGIAEVLNNTCTKCNLQEVIAQCPVNAIISEG